MYSATIQKNKDSTPVDVMPQFSYTSDGLVAITGEENQTVNLQLDTVTSQDWHIDIKLNLQHCPPGMVFAPQNGTCTCPDRKDSFQDNLQCDKQSYTVSIKRNYWIGSIATSNNTDTLVMGVCPYFSCMNQGDSIFTRIPQNMTGLVKDLCHTQNRSGVLCGKCNDGHATAINSLQYVCVPCSSTGKAKNVIVYIAATYLPILILFFAILIFNVHLTTGPINAFIVFAQVLSVNIMDIPIALDESHQRVHKTYAFLYGIFNLNFFSYLLNPFCINSEFNTLDVLLLDYMVATFPLIMIALITMYTHLISDHVHRCLSKLNTLRYSNTTCFASLRHKLQPESLLHALVAFCLLSYTKFSIASTMILTTTIVFNKIGAEVGSRRIFLAGNYTLSNSEYVYHYQILSLVVFTVFVALPPFALLGPLNWFDNFISKYPISRKLWPQDKVHIILDTFQGCYRPQRRFFASVYFLFRLALFISKMFSTNHLQQYTIQQILVTTVIVLIALLQPYRKKTANYVDALLFFNLAVINSLSLHTITEYSNSSQGFNPPKSLLMFQYILIFLPMLFMICYLFSKAKHTHFYHKIKTFLSRKCYKSQDTQPLLDTSSDRHARSYNSTTDESVLFQRANEPNTFRRASSVTVACTKDNDGNNLGSSDVHFRARPTTHPQLVIN